MKTITISQCLLMAYPLVLGLAGCEARLDLEGVEKTLSEPVRRTDQWQAVASNGQTLVVVGQAGVLLTAPLSAEPQWQRQQLPTTAPLVDVASCPDGSFAVLAGNRTVWTRAESSSDWHPHAVDTLESLLTMTCAPDNTLWLGGSFSTLLSSSDGGQQWQEYSIGEDAQLTDIQFVDDQIGYAVGEFGLVVGTADGGSGWQVVGYIPDEFYPQDVWFRDQRQGWVAGLSGTVLRTDDGGRHWVQEATGITTPLYHVGGINNGLSYDRYILGDNSTLLLNPAATEPSWHVSSLTGSPIFLVDALQVEDSLLVVGGGGAIHRIGLDRSTDMNVAIEGAQ